MRPHEVYVDLDGVAKDFIGAALELHGLPAETRELVRGYDESPGIIGVSDLTYWENIERAGMEFWMDIPYLPGAVDFLVSLQKKFPGQVRFLTSPGRHKAAHWAAAGKTRWAEMYWPDIPLVLTRHKWTCAGPGRVLLDDYLPNVEAFRDAGGWAELVKSPWSADGLDFQQILSRLSTHYY